MKASNFRIGNWVTWFHPENGFVECKVDIDILNTMESEYFEDSDTEVEPIPLTEEWLLKFGFDKKTTENGGVLYKKDIHKNYSKLVVCDFGAGLSVDLTTDSGSLFVIGKIDFVNQLQNLYFALTGEELELK